MWLCRLSCIHQTTCSVGFNLPLKLFILNKRLVFPVAEDRQQIIHLSGGIPWWLEKCYSVTEILICLLDKGSACLNFPDFRDIPRIPDSTHAQLESSKFQLWGRKIFSLFYVSTKRLKNVIYSQYIFCLFVHICLNMSSYCVIYLCLIINYQKSGYFDLGLTFDYRLRLFLIEKCNSN